MCVGIFSGSFVVKGWVSQCGLGYMGRTPLICQHYLHVLLLMLLLTISLEEGEEDTLNSLLLLLAFTRYKAL